MERNEIDKKYQWDLTPIFASDEKWEEEYKSLEKEYIEFDFSSYSGKLGDKKTLLDFFSVRDKGMRRLEKLYVYASMRHDEDIRIAKYNSYLSMMGATVAKLMAKLSFVEPELTALSEEKLESYIADPDFRDYDYTLRQIQSSKQHVLSESEERLLALSSDVLGGFQNIFSMIDNANLNLPENTFNGEKVQMSHGLYGLVLHSGKREDRESWFKSYYKAYINLIDTITEAYIGNVKRTFSTPPQESTKTALLWLCTAKTSAPWFITTLSRASITLSPRCTATFPFVRRFWAWTNNICTTFTFRLSKTPTSKFPLKKRTTSLSKG